MNTFTEQQLLAYLEATRWDITRSFPPFEWKAKNRRLRSDGWVQEDEFYFIDNATFDALTKECGLHDACRQVVEYICRFEMNDVDLVWSRILKMPGGTTTTDHRESSDKAAIVSTDFLLREIDASTPTGRKIILARRDTGVSVLGELHTGNPHGFTHWAPLPGFPKGE